eukprot:TRINITY_DN9569_c0_g1_i1.p1 TRINITY_DN9569_c0_g1~~TRINITY_DN9569_c0_g1_i1.p1  ORF type:complete len:420 (-),score=39.25 TRINITY_DN9569_c0_g1_i1:43-1302(-)
METKKVKVVFAGDQAVGKTCLMAHLDKGEFLGDSERPLLWNNYELNVNYDDKQVNFSLWDSPGEEFYDAIRPLTFQQGEIFFICFSVVDRKSVENVSYKWLPEARHFCRDAQIILVGTKIDLRKDPARKPEGSVTFNEGMALAEECGAYAYIETSAATGDNVKELLDMAAEIIVNPGARATKPRKPSKPDEPQFSTKDINLRQAFKKLIGQKEFSDVTFVLTNQREVPAHKIILASNMPAFHAFVTKKGDFPSCFKLRDTITDKDRMIIDVNLEPDTFECILESMYTGTPAHARDFKQEVVHKAFDFFVTYPRYSLSERREVMALLALDPNPPLADVCFEVYGKRRVFAHKVLLYTTSEYFAAIFKSGMKESHVDVISWHDIREGDLAVLKEFLYSESANSLNVKNVADVTRLANKVTF